jgi:zinc transport system substrate-binding protein
MKRKLAFLFAAMALVAAVGAITTIAVSPKAKNIINQQDDKINVLATFYPVYTIGLNLADRIDNIEVKSLTDINTGCLHDYQLTTEDMKLIASADIIIINGGGMESFIGDIISNYPNLKIIDSSKGITMQPDDTWTIDGRFKKESDYNAHIWLDPKLYQKQIENVRDGLADYISGTGSNSEKLLQALDKNTSDYIKKVQNIDSEIEALKADTKAETNQAIIFHNAFAYLANRIGLKVAYSVPLDADTALSAGEIGQIVDVVKADKIKYLFTEKQYGDTIANRIEAETDAHVYTIDSAVTGDGSKDSYLNSMENNLQVLRDALQ